MDLITIYQHPFTSASNVPLNASVKAIGSQMLSTTEHGYILPFEVVSILLLAAMVGCIVIAIKQEPGTKKAELNGVAVPNNISVQPGYTLSANSEIQTPD